MESGNFGMTDRYQQGWNEKIELIGKLDAESLRLRHVILTSDYEPFPGEREAVARRAAELGITLGS